MANYFLTPPRLDSLGLDLAEAWEAGTYCPTEIEGTTHDGREVYIRYRSGTLSIHIADEPGGEALKGTEVLCERLGPRYHGTISLEQVCRIAGITVNGAVPEPAQPDTFGDYLSLEDLSGGTTFYERNLQATGTTAFALIDELLSWPDVCLIEPGETGAVRRQRAAEIECSTCWLLLGPRPTPWQLTRVTGPASIRQMLPDHLAIELNCGWTWSNAKTLRPCVPPLPDQPQPLRIERAEAPACAYNRFALLTRIPRDDQQARERIDAIHALLEGYFPQVRMEYVDIVTTEPVWEADHDDAVDREIIAYLQGGPNRYCSLYNAGTKETPRWTGSRPVRNVPESKRP